MRIARNIDDVKVLNILHKNCGIFQAHYWGKVLKPIAMRISGKFNGDKNVRKSSRDSGPPSRRHSNVRRLSTPQNKTQVELLKLSSRKKEKMDEHYMVK